MRSVGDSHKTARITLTAFKQKIYEDCKQHFGKPEALFCDAGGEFLSVFAQFLKEKHILQKTLRLVSFVEVKNSTMGRFIGYLMDEGHNWTEARTKAIKKMNNIKCRIHSTRAFSLSN